MELRDERKVIAEVNASEGSRARQLVADTSSWRMQIHLAQTSHIQGAKEPRTRSFLIAILIILALIPR